MPDQTAGEHTPEEREALLHLARAAVEATAAGKSLPTVDLSALPPALAERGACFVTLRWRDTGELRGCTGVLVAQGPLAREIVKTAAQSARRDPRFCPVVSQEVPNLEIEISILTPPVRLDVPDPAELPRLIRPGVHGVTLYRRPYRATFLPQVWRSIPDPEEFLDMLSHKMGLQKGDWRIPGIEVEVYQVEEFSESELAEG